MPAPVTGISERCYRPHPLTSVSRRDNRKCVVPAGRYGCVVCCIVLPGFRPWRDVGNLRGAICDLRFTICDLRGCIVTSRVPGGAGRGFRLLTAFATAEVLPWMQGIPPLTAFAAEWWGPPEGTGGDGRRGKKTPATARPSPPPISPFFSPLAAHHSAKRGSVERNLPNCGVRGTICDLRFTVYGLKYSVQFFILHSSFFILNCLIPSALLAAGVLDEALLLEFGDAAFDGA